MPLSKSPTTGKKMDYSVEWDAVEKEIVVRIRGGLKVDAYVLGRIASLVARLGKEFYK